jgi:PKD repeat protein
VYADEGAYTVTLQVCDDNQGCGTDTMIVTVSNAPPEILSITLPTPLESVPFAITANIRDKGTLDSHSATVTWGDKTAAEAAVVTESPAGPPGNSAGASFTVTASHRYPNNGTYTINLCVTDDLSTTCCEETIRVQNVAPAVMAGAPAPLNEGVALTLASTFSDGYDSILRPSQENFTATINWGDGTTEPVTSTTLMEAPGSAAGPTTGTVSAAHA